MNMKTIIEKVAHILSDILWEQSTLDYPEYHSQQLYSALVVGQLHL